MMLTRIPGDFYAAIRNCLGHSGGLFPHEWRNEVVPHKQIGRVYDFDAEAAQAMRDLLASSIASNDEPAPLPDLAETVDEYTLKVALWLWRQDIGPAEATESLRAMLSGLAQPIGGEDR